MRRACTCRPAPASPGPTLFDHGNVPLSGVTVSDSISGVNPVPVFSGGNNVGDLNSDGLLEAGETWGFSASGIAVVGQYSNVGTATGTPSNTSGTPISGASTQTATNPDNYFGYTTNISIVKLTNGSNNDSPPGLYVPAGTSVTWTDNAPTTATTRSRA